VPVLAFAALAFGALAGGLLGRAAFALLGLERRRGLRASAFVAVGLTVAVVALGGVTVFRPMPTTAAAPAPSGVRFWNLPTGSHIAYVHASADGKARPTPVIFLHGGPGTPGEGIPTGGGELAADGFDVYAYDQLGAGRSTRLRDITGYTVTRQVADLEAIRRTLDADRIILVGQSWGGSLAASTWRPTASTWPKRCSPRRARCGAANTPAPQPGNPGTGSPPPRRHGSTG
jgi:proline iminopeptidase